MRRVHRSAHVAIWLTLAWVLPLMGLSAYALRGAAPITPVAERLSGEAGG